MYVKWTQVVSVMRNVSQYFCLKYLLFLVSQKLGADNFSNLRKINIRVTEQKKSSIINVLKRKEVHMPRGISSKSIVSVFDGFLHSVHSTYYTRTNIRHSRRRLNKHLNHISDYMFFWIAVMCTTSYLLCAQRRVTIIQPEKM